MKTRANVLIKMFLFAVMAFIMTGCASIPSVNLTDDEMEIVSEYAAGLIKKYSVGHEAGLMRVYDLRYDDLYVLPTPTPTPLPTVEVPQEEADVSDADVDAEVKTEEEFTAIPLNAAFGLNEAGLEFAYAEITETYPKADDGEELVMSMNATEGKNLLIMHFALTNASGEQINCDTNLMGYKVRCNVNDDVVLRGEVTLLENDLLNYSDVLAPGEARDVVLVFEIDAGINVSNLGITLINGNEKLRYGFV